jgi:hypothetical protein
LRVGIPSPAPVYLSVLYLAGKRREERSLWNEVKHSIFEDCNSAKETLVIALQAKNEDQGSPRAKGSVS